MSFETIGEVILNLSGQIDLPIALETSHYLFNIQSGMVWKGTRGQNMNQNRLSHIHVNIEV